MSWLFFSSFCNAQDIQLTPNVITNNNWSGAVVGGSISPGGTTGGSKPAYNPSTNTILFGYTQGSVEQSIIMSNVFENTGIRVYGYELSAHFMNSGYSRGTLGLTVTGRDAAGFPLQKDSYNIPSGNTANGEWGYFSTTRPYSSPTGINFMQSMTVTATGKDDRYWAGYYGPQLRDVSFRIRYVADECKTNPLYSLSCPGYEEAYLITQCNINSLYSPSCAGYQQAYTNQQCSINPLYSPTCPGYQNAYLNQQCSINPLYNTACTGYAEALLAQQCSISSLYSPSCPGYAQALFTKTCNENQLSSPKCPLYEAAYLDQQCKVSQLFSTACPLYQKAFFDQQCAMSPLYNAACPGYAEAFRSKQIADACLTNPQSSPTCKGYVAPQQSVSTATATVTTTVSSVILPGQDAIKSITQPQVTSDPIVNQVIQTDGVKQEQSQQPQVQQPSSQRSGQQSTQRTSGGQEQRASSRTVQDARSRTQQAARRDAQQVQQDTAISSMAEVPGFSNYEQAKLPDVPFYKVEDIYKRVAITDNARALRQLNQRSDRIHKEMVDEQYRK